MYDSLLGTIAVASSGLKAQGLRMRVVAENVANANSTASVPGGDPYRRKTITFEAELDRSIGASLVDVKSIGVDRSLFKQVYNPNHPAADEAGYVKMPNVSTLIEMADMREATRAYEANLNMVEQARSMLMRTTDLIRR
ncbi:flagellar basal body rod protein FlgC [Rhodospirillaceae bacterium SYSU D60014]|jgi:flagellar basal-body rod protein FlgC|uniref:flagellar basal body rod protein FlgC n=1 Tax=Virgifigura deserti TaxID=2268457 RepID=UPI000E66CE1A